MQPRSASKQVLLRHFVARRVNFTGQERGRQLRELIVGAGERGFGCACSLLGALLCFVVQARRFLEDGLLRVRADSELAESAIQVLFQGVFADRRGRAIPVVAAIVDVALLSFADEEARTERAAKELAVGEVVLRDPLDELASETGLHDPEGSRVDQGLVLPLEDFTGSLVDHDSRVERVFQHGRHAADQDGVATVVR